MAAFFVLCFCSLFRYCYMTLTVHRLQKALRCKWANGLWSNEPSYLKQKIIMTNSKILMNCFGLFACYKQSIYQQLLSSATAKFVTTRSNIQNWTKMSTTSHLGHRCGLAGLELHRELIRTHGGVQQDFPLYSDHSSHLRRGQSSYVLEKSAPDLVTNATFCTDIKSSVSVSTLGPVSQNPISVNPGLTF